MKKLLLTIFGVSIAAFSFSQASLSAGLDQVICAPNTSATLTATLLPQAPIAYAPDSYIDGITVPFTQASGMGDDNNSDIIPIGFNFCFMGNTYNKLVVSTNNYVTFDLSTAGNYSPWSTIAVPDANAPTNAIMAPWQDIQPSVGGQIKYKLYGTAPYRHLTIMWSGIPMFSCTGLIYSSQLMLFETTGIIESHILNKPYCSWNGGNAVHALHNIDGTVADVVTGRNNTPWTISNEGYRWTPTGANPVINWYSNGNLIGTGATITVSPTVDTEYTCQIDNGIGGVCGSGIISDNVMVLLSAPALTTTSQNVDCLLGIEGSMSATVTGAAAPYTISWNTIPVSNTATVTNVNPGNYTVTLTDAKGCTASQALTIAQQGALPFSVVSTTNLLCNGVATGNIIVEGLSAAVPFNYALGAVNSTNGVFSNLAAGIHVITITDDIGCTAVETITLTQPANPLSLLVTAENNVSCFDLSDGAFTMQANGGTQPYNYSNGNTNNSTGVFNSIPASAYTLSVTDANGCFVTLKDTIHQPNQLIASIATSSNVLCKGQSNGTATSLVIGGTAPYVYNWNSNPLQNSAVANNLPIGNYTLNISDNHGCSTSTSVTISEPDALAITASDDLFVCESYETMLNAHATGGEGLITYLWMPGALQNDSVTIAPTANTTFTVTATDANGCSISESVNVTVYTSPQPIISASTVKGCQTLCPTFTDLTTDPIGSLNVTREWSFGDGGVGLNKSQLDYCYKKDGIYDVTLTVITDKGCRKTATWEKYIEVYPLPVANFTTDPTETDILKPFVYVTNTSTGGDVYSWNYGDSDSLFLNASANHHTYQDTGLYSIHLVAQTNKGCIDSAKSFIRITPYYSMFLPTSFTPNGDGLNDVFEIKGSYIQACNLEIFDRWGILMYNRAGTSDVFWDGANAPQGVYVYKLKMKDTQNKDYEYIGQITVYR